MNSSYELVSLYMDVCWCIMCPHVLERSDGMCHQLQIDGGGWTKGPFFSKKEELRTGNCFFIWIFLTSFMSLAGPMNAGSIFIFFLNVQTWQSHDVIFTEFFRIK